MITKVSELFEELLRTEAEVLAESKIAHAPTIGEMYEGLSSKLLEIALPLEGTELKVTRGFCRSESGNLSSEIDCMIVLGEGEQVPNTQKFIYPIDKVLVIIEVKKALNKDELRTTIAKINRLRTIKGEMFYNKESDDAFARMLRKRPFLVGNPEIIGENDDFVKDVAIADANLPLRVILDYSGYKTSKGLLEAFVNSIIELSEEDVSGSVGHPAFWPNIIISQNTEIVKLFGNPYSCKQEDGQIPVLGLSRANYGVILLESILRKIGAHIDQFLPLYSDYESPKLLKVFTMNINDEEGSAKCIFPEFADQCVLQIDEDEELKELTFDEAKVAMMFQYNMRVPLDDPDIWEGLEIPESDFQIIIDALEAKGICFKDQTAAYSIFSELSVVIEIHGGDDPRVVGWAGENCRGAANRKAMSKSAAFAKEVGLEEFAHTHITTLDHLDFSNAVATVSVVPTEVIMAAPGQADILRYQSIQIAKQFYELQEKVGEKPSE